MRIFDSGNDAHDFCKSCYPTEQVAERKYGNVAKTGEGPDGRGNCWGYDAEHPDYEGEGYTCARCRAVLTEEDN